MIEQKKGIKIWAYLRNRVFMRLWSIHPRYLDTKGLVALWREALLAKKVLEGHIRGYKNHPQLERFKNYRDPLSAINSYLYYVYLEAKDRGYNFDVSKIEGITLLSKAIPVTEGQLLYELKHLCNKLKVRDKDRFFKFCLNLSKEQIEPHPIFFVISGEVETWERVRIPLPKKSLGKKL